MKDYVYIKVSDDEYELIEAIADSASELARIVGVKEDSIYSMCYQGQKGIRRGVYKKVCISEDIELDLEG